MTFADQPRPFQNTATCTGADICDLLDALSAWLEAHAEHLNSLNVFPVPDGDTGINMSRTLRAASTNAAVERGVAHETLHAASRGALLGAAGNSGVILSQMLRGFAEAYASDPVCDGRSLRQALQAAAEAGYKSVSAPVEGTMLTVAREAAAAVQDDATLSQGLQQALQAATKAVELTPSLLEKLRLAGVVDAGGEGLRLILEGTCRWLRGEELRDVVPPSVTSMALVGAQHAEEAVGFCTQFIVERSIVPMERLKEQLGPLASSLIVVGTSEVLRIHAHADRPGQVLDLAIQAGSVSHISIENMELQHTAAQNQALTGRIGIITVAPSSVAARFLESLGATHVIVPEGSSPSVLELINAVQRLGHEHLILLPNDKNSFMAAEQLQGMTSRSVHVIPTENVVQATQCLLAFNSEHDLQSQLARLTAARDTATIIELARAHRPADLPDTHVQIGDIVALHENEIVHSSETLTDTIRGALGRVGACATELITLYSCADFTEPERQEAESCLRALLPEADLETVSLGIPARLAIISLE
ncbi:MAG: DAK2 domain-containing protein [Chloroflexota bacterium]